MIIMMWKRESRHHWGVEVQRQWRGLTETVDGVAVDRPFSEKSRSRWGDRRKDNTCELTTHTLSLSLNVNIYLGKKTPGWCPESGSLQEFSVSTLNKNKTGACVQKLSLLRSQLPEISQTSSLLKGSATLHSWDFWSQKTLRACS